MNALSHAAVISAHMVLNCYRGMLFRRDTLESAKGCLRCAYLSPTYARGRTHWIENATSRSINMVRLLDDEDEHEVDMAEWRLRG